MKFYSVKEAATILSMSVVWVDKKIREGKIIAVWFGGIRKISEEEIKRIVKEGVK